MSLSKWLGGVSVKALDLRSRGGVFDYRLRAWLLLGLSADSIPFRYNQRQGQLSLPSLRDT